MFLDLKATGPFVIEPPKQSLCVVDDFWFRYVADMGIAGPDKGEGGKYLFLPPGYEGDVPDGYFVYRPLTFTNWVVFRALGGVPALEETRVYPLAEADDPPPVEFVNIADHRFNTVHANDFSFYEEINTIVQEEPTTSLDPERAGQLAAIGIVHGQPFRPDDQLRPSSTTPPAPRPPSAGRSFTPPVTPRPPSSRGHRGRKPSSVAATSSSTTVPACSTPACVPLLRHRYHPGHGPRPGRGWLGLCVHGRRRQRRRPRRCQGLHPHPSARIPRPGTSGRWTSTTPRLVPFCRPTTPTPAS